MCFTLDEDELTLMDIARKMLLPTTTVSRMVNTLVGLGFSKKVRGRLTRLEQICTIWELSHGITLSCRR